MNDSNQFERINLLARKWQKGTITESEREEFEQWYASFDDVLEITSRENRAEAEQRIYNSILNQGHVKARSSFNSYFIGTAAAIVFCLLVTGYFFIYKKSKQANTLAGQNIYLSPVGKKKSITLSDGTTVLLNSGSKLTVLPGYNHHNRKVALDGEAYFTVVHNAKSPFSVHTVNFDVYDLGTIFNIKAYKSDRASEAVLIKGSIKVVLNNKLANTVVLTPSKKFVLNNLLISNLQANNGDKANPVYQVKGIANNIFKNSIVETDWTANKLTFYDEPFEEIVPIIERWYGLKLIVNNKELSGYRFTATFGNQSIEQVLKALNYTANFNYRKEGNVITIY